MGFALSVRVVRISSFLCAILLLLANTLEGQAAKPANAASAAQTAPPSTSPVAVIKASTHLVTVDVVVTDHHGAIVPNLTAKDFEVFEQVPGKKGQREQKISQFEFVTQATVAAAAKEGPKIPTGVFTNLIARRLPVPPTVLLVDGINTDVDAGMQARRQMVKMLASIPPDTPIAVFLLGRQLRLLQGFTTDPKLLRDAAQKALSLDSAEMANVDARDDPNSLSQQVEEMFGTSGDETPPPSQGVAQMSGAPGGAAAPTGPPGGELQMAAIERFERETFAATMDIRVQTTLDALRTLARHLSGYSGRKNLIWISASFPLTISPDATQQHNLSFEGNRNYAREVESVTNALADAKIAVYPVNPLGVQTQAYFDVAVRRSTVGYGNQQNTMKNSLNRENDVQFASQESMQSVAEQTGGKICVNNNDLADCVKTAVTEGSSYYEIAYYPDASDWHGEFHKISVKATHPGLQLSFRQGYFARAGDQNVKPDEKSGNDPQLQEAACGDLLTSTSVLVVAEALPPDQPGQVKYFMAIDGKMLTFSTAGDGNHNMRLDLAICTLDRGGKPLQYLQDHVQQQLGDKEFATTSAHGVSHVVQFAPKPDTVKVRLVVRDVGSGRLGSVDIPYPAPAKSTSASK
jgi:VWFA-related protein